MAKNPDDWDKWLECNGQSISQSTYPELYAVVGSNVPDYQGMFLRGYGSQASSHYGSVTHSSGSLGTLQGDAIRNLTGSIQSHFFLFEPGTKVFYGTSTYDIVGAMREHVSSFAYSGLGFDASRAAPTSTENRPVNKAVRYFIRAKP